MSVIRLILLVAAAALFVLFAVSNWTLVTVSFGATLIDIRLPLVVLISILIGALPLYVRNRFAQRSWTRRLARLEDAPVAIVPDKTMPSEAQPTVVPLGAG